MDFYSALPSIKLVDRDCSSGLANQASQIGERFRCGFSLDTSDCDPGDGEELITGRVSWNRRRRFLSRIRGLWWTIVVEVDFCCWRHCPLVRS